MAIFPSIKDFKKAGITVDNNPDAKMLHRSHRVGSEGESFVAGKNINEHSFQLFTDDGMALQQGFDYNLMFNETNGELKVQLLDPVPVGTTLIYNYIETTIFAIVDVFLLRREMNGVSFTDDQLESFKADAIHEIFDVDSLYHTQRNIDLAPYLNQNLKAKVKKVGIQKGGLFATVEIIA